MSRRTKIINVGEITSPTTLQRAASRIEEEPVTPLGRPNNISEVKKELFSARDCAGIQQDLNLTQTKTKVLLRGVRCVGGSKTIIEKNAYKTIQDRNHRLDEFFELRQLTYRRVDKEDQVAKNVEVPTIVCSDLPGLIEKVMEEREREDSESILIKISIDGGGGFLKFCTSIFDIEDPSPRMNTGMSRKFLESGVKRVLIIGLAPNVSEDYVNVKRIWLDCGIDKLRKYTIATDLKLCNVLLGMMNHSSCHPCAWCDVKKEFMHRKGKQRTIASLMKLFFDFFDSRKDKKDAKYYGNVIHPPMICDDVSDNTPVICVIPPPELHLLIGPVNKMSTELESLWPASEEWLKSCNVKKEEYHGGTFAGNDSRQLLRNVNRLEALRPPEACKKFVNAFKSFNDVVSACYGSNLDADYLQKISIFAADYFRLGISVTPKVHAVIYHIPEFCELMGRGLGPWSEQTGESVHHDFKEMWQRYKVKDETRPIYG